MIVVTIQDAIAIHAAICKLPKLPVKAAFKLARISEALRDELRVIETFRRLASNDPDKRKEMQEKMASHLNKKIQLNFELIHVEELAITGVELQPHFLATLSPLLTNGEHHG